MKVITIQTHQPGNPLLWQTVPDLSCGPEDVLVDVRATALNRADLMQRAGNYPPPPGASDVLGLEMAGVISKVGTQVSGWHIGDRVCALLSGGGYATQARVPHQLLMPIPKLWTFEQAAALPEVFYTAYVNLFIEAGLQPDETVLIHGGASGVGTAGIQLAREAGCRIFATAGTAEKTARCVTLGAEQAIDYKQTDFAEEILTYTEGQGVDVILDMVGGDYLERNVQLLKLRGRLVVIALLGGAKAEINLASFLRRRLRLIGSVLRARTLAEKMKIKKRFMDQFWTALQEGTIEPIIDSVYPISEAEAAHAYMASNLNIGKIILKIPDKKK
jgi:tumor protein p53-inducible protein 3